MCTTVSQPFTRGQTSPQGQSDRASTSVAVGVDRESFGMYSSGMAGSCSSVFSFVPNFYTDSHHSWQVQSSPTMTRFSSFNTFSNSICYYFFFMLDILTGVSCNFQVVLICICLIANGLENFFRHVLSMCISLFENCLFSALLTYWSDDLQGYCWYSVFTILYTSQVKCLV